jgi:hypothetical protein
VNGQPLPYGKREGYPKQEMFLVLIQAIYSYLGANILSNGHVSRAS